ncbi:MAG: G5 domain-containing protein [Anaerolineales bacterium]|nr:G5 domain-containing protein [Anaerolineales bacterium]
MRDDAPQTMKNGTLISRINADFMAFFFLRVLPRSSASYFQNRASVITLLLALTLAVAACSGPAAVTSQQAPLTIQLSVDGTTQTFTTRAATVRQLLDENNIELGELDEVTPPPFTPLENDQTVTIVRVSESLEVIQQTLPFERKIVRSESMNEEDEPVIVQAGQDGLQETTWRIVYRDGLEAERWPTNTVIVEPAQEEIMMVGVGAARGNITFSGTLAYISDAGGVIMRGATAFPEQVNTGGPLDGRVFSLSPTGSHLLFTRTTTETTRFENSLWVVSTASGAEPEPLGVENVLWADWNPAQIDPFQIAYTTARATDAPPGWEANNDLWLLTFPLPEDAAVEPLQLVEAYPATYGWWGGNYAWSPNGRFLAYSYADEVGVLAFDTETETVQRRQLQKFTEYNTLSNWVWVPTLTWSPDSRFLAYTNHGGDDTQAIRFDSWIVDVATGIAGQVVDQTGMWGHVQWNRVADGGVANGRIAFLRAIDPVDSQRSNYTLWLMDRDGSNARQIYPSVGENSSFPRTPNFMAWGPTGEDVALIFNNDLFFLNLLTNEARRVTQDDAVNSHPVWAPYGIGLSGPVVKTSVGPEPTATPDRDELFLPDE